MQQHNIIVMVLNKSWVYPHLDMFDGRVFEKYI